jgi:hypothetical protein
MNVLVLYPLICLANISLFYNILQLELQSVLREVSVLLHEVHLHFLHGMF